MNDILPHCARCMKNRPVNGLGGYCKSCYAKEQAEWRAIKKQRISICPTCKGEFSQTHGRKYCSKDCHPKPLYVSKPLILPRVCDFCGGGFSAKSVNNRFCSTVCQQSSKSSGTFVIFERDGFCCFYCGKSPDDGIKLHVDHIIPIVDGGRDVAGNLVTACNDCNLEKGVKVIDPKTYNKITERNRLKGIHQEKKIRLKASHFSRTNRLKS